MSKRKGPLCEDEAEARTRHPEKRIAWTFKIFEVTSLEDLRAVLVEIKPFFASVQSVIVSAANQWYINLSWTELDDFQLGDQSEKQCWIQFYKLMLKQYSLDLFRVLFQTASKLSRLEVTNTLGGQDSLPPLREIVACLSGADCWQLHLRHLSLRYFSVAQNTFEELETYPEQLTSLTIDDCSWEGTGIDHFLSNLTQLETCEIRNDMTHLNWPRYRLMNTSLRNMTKLRTLTLYGEADPHDEAGMEAFVENLTGLTQLRNLCVFVFANDDAMIAEEGEDNLQDKLLKLLPRTAISRFQCRTIVQTQGRRGECEPSLSYCSDSIDALANYVSNMGQCKLSYISLDFSSFVPVDDEDQNDNSLVIPTEFEERLLRAVSKGLSISMITMPTVDTSSTPIEGPKIRGMRIHLPRVRRLNFRGDKGNLVSTRMHYLLNSFYLPIVNALRDKHLPLGLWPRILTKSRPNGKSHQWVAGHFKFEPNLHGSALFTLLRGRPSIVSRDNVDHS